MERALHLGLEPEHRRRGAALRRRGRRRPRRRLQRTRRYHLARDRVGAQPHPTRQRDRQLHQERAAHPSEDHARLRAAPARSSPLRDVGRRHRPPRAMSTTAAPAASPRVYLATAGVFLGAGIVSLSQRLLSVGLPDLRGALGLGFDEAAWIPTAFNAALMFMGPLSVFFGTLV